MSKKDKKVPRIDRDFEADKRPRTEAVPTSYRDQYPVWRIGQMDWVGPYTWDAHDEGSIRELLMRLKGLESMRFMDFEGPQESHPITVARCCDAAKRRLKELKLDQLEFLYSLRITGRRRAIGIREGNVVRLLWWDPEHGVCPSNKKNT